MIVRGFLTIALLLLLFTGSEAENNSFAFGMVSHESVADASLSLTWIKTHVRPNHRLSVNVGGITGESGQGFLHFLQADGTWLERPRVKVLDRKGAILATGTLEYG